MSLRSLLSSENWSRQLADYFNFGLAVSREKAADELVAAKLARQGEKILSRWNAHMYSQNFEDAMIAEVVARIGDGSKTFVEIGVETGEECNSRLLLQLGWRGLWLEGDAASVAKARVRFAREIAEGRLAVEQLFVTVDNVQEAIARHGFDRDLDFLSVDVDMNTSHIWRAIQSKPRFACIEYNGNLPPNIDYEVLYDPKAVWMKDACYGASVPALERIGREKGMSLVGCDICGVNAFFVRDDLTGDHFVRPFDSATHWEPLRMTLVGRRGHARP
ncbi:MAG: hypothetical protein ACK5JM_09435 [Rhodoblastus sp.]